MLLVGAQGEWKTLESYGIGRRWKADASHNHWTSHEPMDKNNVQATEYWFSRTELLFKKHMKPNFRTFRNEEPKG
jgi:hypothetical protein